VTQPSDIILCLCVYVCVYVGLPITPCSRASWDAQLLKIPAVSPSVMNCCVIRVEYYVKVCVMSMYCHQFVEVL
jgi:hypothetical protein